MAKKDKRKDDWDTGVVIAPMNGDELPKYRRMAYMNQKKRPTKDERKMHKDMYTPKERRAIMRAGLLVMLPRLLLMVVGFAIAILILWLWLR